MKKTALIIEDSLPARNSLKYDLNSFPFIEVLGESGKVSEAVDLIKTHQPDILFLDIELLDGNGFEVLEQTKEFDYKVIFTTAYESYALKAIKFSAFDYLLKPIIFEELENTLNRLTSVSEKEVSENLDTQYQVLKDNMQLEKPSFIVLSTENEQHICKVEDIVYCEADRGYTTFYFKKGKPILVSKTIGIYEEILSDHSFIRPHQSYLVNLRYIENIQNENSMYSIELPGNVFIPVSRRKKAVVLEAIHCINE